jgi:Carboxypeptidase regulatory-like domain
MRSKIVHLPRLLVIFIMVLGARTLLAQEPKLGFPAIQSMGRVKGTVMDANGAVISTPRPSIIFEGRNEVKTVAANERGDYEITLTAGIYRVTTEIPGFYPFRRAALRVLPGSDTLINIVPTPRYLVRGTTVSGRESADVAAPSPRYDEFDATEGPVSLLIQFQKKRRANGNIEYKGAILTYDALTIHSDRLSFNKTRLRLNASGERVVVENGEQRIQVKQARVTFKGGEPILALTR